MRDAMTDVVMLVPGLGGSVLEREGRVLWGADGHAGVGALLGAGADGLDALRLEDERARAELADGVRATGIVRGTHVLPGVWKIDGYAKLAQLLGRLFDVQPGANYLEFAYDWRRDLRTSARQLQKRSQEALEQWRAASGNGDARVVLLAHSAGAMVARYYLEALDGWKDARALITFGAPFRGTPAALGALLDLTTPAALRDTEMTALLRGFTSLYQLLPTYPVLAREDESLARVGEEPLAGLDESRLALAAEMRAELDEALARHANNPAYRSEGYQLVPIIGAAQSTPQSVSLAGGQPALLRSYQHRDLSGDGIVPRLGAQPAENGETPTTLLTPSRHAELQNDDRALSYVLGVFTSLFMGAGPVTPPVRTRVGVDLQVDDLVRAGEPVRVRAHPEAAIDAPLTATLEHAVTGEAAGSVTLEAGAERWHHGELAAPGAGLYRVRVAGADTVHPVSDVLEVLAG